MSNTVETRGDRPAELRLSRRAARHADPRPVHDPGGGGSVPHPPTADPVTTDHCVAPWRQSQASSRTPGAMRGSAVSRRLAVLLVLVMGLLAVGGWPAAAQGRLRASDLLVGSDCALAKEYNPITQQPGLAGRTLTRCDLRFADLRFADLSGAFLSGADLRFATLRGASLINTDLHEADLREANLRGTNQRGADLREADLRGADLTGADLTAANLVDVQWGDTICPDGSNSDTNGDTCEGHLTP